MTRASQHRTGSKGRERREEILETAAQLFTARGYESTTAQDVSDTIGVTKASLYYYFRSKEQILFNVLLRNHEQLHAHVVAGVDGIETGTLEAIQTFVTRHVGFVLTHRAVSSLYSEELLVIRSVDPWWETLLASRRKHEKVLLGLITDAQARGQAAPEPDAALTTRALLSLANASLRWFSPKGPYTPEEVAAHHADLAIRSLRR